MLKTMPEPVIMDRQKRILSEFIAIAMAFGHGRLICLRRVLEPPFAAPAALCGPLSGVLTDIRRTLSVFHKSNEPALAEHLHEGHDAHLCLPAIKLVGCARILSQLLNCPGAVAPFPDGRAELVEL